MDQSPKILLVEGQDDKHVVCHLWKRLHQSRTPFGIHQSGGIDELCKVIDIAVKTSGRAAVGIVADANDDLDARWDAISHRLQEAEIGGIPAAPSPDGTIVDATPRVGVWLMPNNQSLGELEDFVQEMIPSSDPAWPLAQKYIEDIPKQTRKFSAGKTSRAELHAWLATREEPGRMGSAIGRRDLNTDGPLCSAFLEWIERLFG